MGDQSNKNQRAWLGIVLVTLGAYFLLRNFYLIPPFLPYWMFGWEMIFVVVGGAMLVTGRREGFIFLLIGGFFLAPDVLGFRFRIRDWWPVILIFVGIGIFLRRSGGAFGRGSAEDDNDYLKDTSIFGGSNKYFTSKNFQGGSVTSIFGGSEIDLSEAELGKEEVVLDLFCLFGGNEIRVPNDWTVINDSFVLFGGFEDRRRRLSEDSFNPHKVLRIKGTVIFGGNELKGA
ncbi:MAG: DUF5668 domain-containing protein [Bacteroidota bacterium]